MIRKNASAGSLVEKRAQNARISFAFDEALQERSGTERYKRALDICIEETTALRVEGMDGYVKFYSCLPDLEAAIKEGEFSDGVQLAIGNQELFWNVVYRAKFDKTDVESWLCNHDCGIEKGKPKRRRTKE
jgi:hypothetical protein